MDADRVLVMAAGTVEELGHPRELAAKIGSRFAALVAKSKEHAVGTNAGDGCHVGISTATAAADGNDTPTVAQGGYATEETVLVLNAAPAALGVGAGSVKGSSTRKITIV